MAPQPQPRVLNNGGTGSQLWCCSVVSLTGSSEFLASSLFEVGSSSVNRASPFWSVHGISLQVSRIDVAPLEISFDRVFIPQFWSTLVSFAGLSILINTETNSGIGLMINFKADNSILLIVSRTNGKIWWIVRNIVLKEANIFLKEANIVVKEANIVVKEANIVLKIY